ncbi:MULTISPECIES: YciC family protein [unclassified Pseudomonas]|uniref:YciC family protein n=1 Tax=unclassified Pseudomonas TaxID=196821 RepID=UPI002AC958CF|nr:MULTISPECIES: YciC family protein [unclassified Pseudomonas]MEB0043094.1 YciC family protein [Pseudomonas sp. MH10]MEB0076714.1 YciC family protein [Pseudomonas sp. MH10out]MEB0090354.1 YciC family protein [Pseudomonas sp. CCI4.2]MEB0103613.1 YciC family protein [Pseudomonas sp. CCI3.2]MEB0120757.1 YciC family protein [Pseudomonas sp. CCI1.2]
MNPLTVLQDSLYFFRRNLTSILMLCLPLVVLEALSKQALSNALASNASQVYELLIGLLFYPLYTGALILFLDARSRSEQPRKRDLMAMALRLWPTFAVMSALSTLLIMFGLSMFVVPGIWVMVKLAFSEYLLVLRGMTPLAAMRESIKMTQGHFLRILACVLCVYIPLSALEGVSLFILPEPLSAPVSLLIDSISSFLQLFTSVVIFRLFMLINEPPEKSLIL